MEEKNPKKDDVDPNDLLPSVSTGGLQRHNRKRYRKRNPSKLKSGNTNSNEYVVIEGSHTTATDTDNIPPRRGKHVSFENAVEVRQCFTPERCTAEDSIRGVPLDTTRASAEEKIKACIDGAFNVPRFITEDVVKACVDGTQEQSKLPEEHVKACIDRAQSPPALSEDHVKACIDIAENVAVLPEDNIKTCIFGTRNEPVLPEDNVRACIDGTETLAVLPEDYVMACILGLRNEPVLPQDNVKACIDGTENRAVLPEYNIKACIIGTQNEPVLPEGNVKACIDGTPNKAILPEDNIKACIIGTQNEPVLAEDNVKACIDGTPNKAILPEDNIKACIIGTQNEPVLPEDNVKACIDGTPNKAILSEDNVKVCIIGTMNGPVQVENNVKECIAETQNVSMSREDKVKACIVGINNEPALPDGTENIEVLPKDDSKANVAETKREDALPQDNVKECLNKAKTVAKKTPVLLEENSNTRLESGSSNSSLKIKSFSFHFHEYKTKKLKTARTEKEKPVSELETLPAKKPEKRKLQDDNGADSGRKRSRNSSVSEDGSEEKTTVQKAETVQPQSKVVPASDEISERFKNIMVMFDSFTKNLGTLEIQNFRDRNEVCDYRRDTSKSRDRTDPSSRVHRSRFEDYMDEKRDRCNASDIGGSQRELRRSPTPMPARIKSKKRSSSVIPAFKDAATSMSVHNVTASVQTQVLQPLTNAGLANELKPHPRAHSSPASVSADLSTSQSELRSETNSFKVQNYHMDSASLVATTSKTICNSPHYMKVSKSPSVVELVPCGAAGERLYHTIHIDTTSSPPSSVMRRRPVWQRFWDVITGFCSAMCMCLQVNKDCIFCFGFFITFVVSASFLTAFFYRTLSVNSAIIQREAVPLEIEISQNPKDAKLYY